MRILLSIFSLTAFLFAPISADAAMSTLERIQKTGKIKIGYRDLLPPMSFVDKDGKPAGYSIDLCERVAEAAKAKIGSNVAIEYIPVTAEDRFSALTENRIDILCGSTTKTLSRSELVDFTQVTFITGASFMVLRESKFPNRFNGKKIGVVKGTTTAAALEKILKDTSTDAEIVRFDSTAEGFEALQKKSVDAFTADQVVLIGLASTSEQPERFSVLPDLHSFEPLALAVRRNDADFRLVADRVIADLYRTKKILMLYDKWFGAFSPGRPPAFELLIQLNAIPE